MPSLNVQDRVFLSFLVLTTFCPSVKVTVIPTDPYRYFQAPTQRRYFWYRYAFHTRANQAPLNPRNKCFDRVAS